VQDRWGEIDALKAKTNLNLAQLDAFGNLRVTSVMGRHWPVAATTGFSTWQPTKLA